MSVISHSDHVFVQSCQKICIECYQVFKWSNANLLLIIVFLKRYVLHNKQRNINKLPIEKYLKCILNIIRIWEVDWDDDNNCITIITLKKHIGATSGIQKMAG